MFCKESLLYVVMNLQDVNSVFICGDVELVCISEVGGCIVVEGVLLYLLGVLCVVFGEIWGGVVQCYFLVLEEGINLLFGFLLELQGVYSEIDVDGI